MLVSKRFLGLPSLRVACVALAVLLVPVLTHSPEHFQIAPVSTHIHFSKSMECASERVTAPEPAVIVRVRVEAPDAIPPPVSLSVAGDEALPVLSAIGSPAVLRGPPARTAL